MKSGDIHIGFDLDGVLIDHSQVKVDLASEFGVKVPQTRTNAAFLANHFKKLKKYYAFQERLYNDPVISLRAPLMRDAVSTLDALTSVGIAVTLVSRRREPQWAQKILEHHGLSPKYFDEANTYFVRKPEEKNHVALRTGITHFIDDEPRILRHLLDVPNHFLLDPYSVFPLSESYVMVRSHKEFLDHILPE